MQAETAKLYGLVAEYETAAVVIKAATAARTAGYRAIDAFSPFPVHGLDDAVGAPPRLLPRIIFCGGLTGFIVGFGMQYISCVLHYPLNVGGRPLNSWPQFIPITFECTILFAAFSALFGMLILNGLPKPHHPLFALPAFKRASQDRFFLCIEHKDAQFDRVKTRRFLEQSGAVGVYEVES